MGVGTVSKGPSDETRTICGERDNARCVRCGKSLYNTMASLHHRRMRSHPFTGLHEPSNLIWLCGSGDQKCHGYVHAHPKESYERGWLVSMVKDPAEVPVSTFLYGSVLLDDAGGFTRV